MAGRWGWGLALALIALGLALCAVRTRGAVRVGAATVTVTIPRAEFDDGVQKLCERYGCPAEGDLRLRLDCLLSKVTGGTRGSLSSVEAIVTVTP